MNAVRRDETLDNLHSVYVDQWDWEIIINREDRKIEKLKDLVVKIWASYYKTHQVVTAKFPALTNKLPADITFISTQQMEDEHPELTPKQREDFYAKQHGAIFITQIGGALNSGTPHDLRAPDYDDWSLNGDILVWYPPLDRAIELSSMGIRVDEIALAAQLKTTNMEHRRELDFHKKLLANELPLTIGGGIGQSRICMTLLEKVHLGEVQSSVWPETMVAECAQKGVVLL